MEKNHQTFVADFTEKPSLRTMLENLYVGMESHNDGQKFTDRERAMIRHAMFVGAATVMAVANCDTENPPGPQECAFRAAILAQFKAELDHYEKFRNERREKHGDEQSFSG